MMQNDAFGGGMPTGQNAAAGDDLGMGDAAVRRADHQQEDQLIGGYDEYRP